VVRSFLLRTVETGSTGRGPIGHLLVWLKAPSGYPWHLIPSHVDDTLPELAPFVHAVQARRPDDGTWCEEDTPAGDRCDHAESATRRSFE
jgi:hypothetical protein